MIYLRRKHPMSCTCLYVYHVVKECQRGEVREDVLSYEGGALVSVVSEE